MNKQNKKTNKGPVKEKKDPVKVKKDTVKEEQHHVKQRRKVEKEHVKENKKNTFVVKQEPVKEKSKKTVVVKQETVQEKSKTVKAKPKPVQEKNGEGRDECLICVSKFVCCLIFVSEFVCSRMGGVVQHVRSGHGAQPHLQSCTQHSQTGCKEGRLDGGMGLACFRMS